MAYSKVPTDWMPSWSEDGTDITVPIASFPEMTAGKADGTTGDIAEILFAILEQLCDVFYAQATADKPAQWYMARSSSTDPVTGVTTNQYSIRLNTAVAAGSRLVVDEA